MTIGYLDAFSGISGDMMVGALLDAGAEFPPLERGLLSLGTEARFRAEKVRRGAIAATKFHVDAGETRGHRHLPHILRIIEGGDLPAPVKQNAARVFQRLGEAEARVHGIPVEKVHFHEVGAVDSICDIVGACLGLHLLGVERLLCSPVNVGAGKVRCDHGVLPVPAPATAALLENIPVYSRGPQRELTTPTGAAIAATLAAGFGPLPAMTISGCGYGAGGADFPEHANVLRFLRGLPSGAPESVTVSVLEANIDDCSAEVLGFAMERLLEAGALDVSFSPLFMKKNRPGALLRVVARPEQQEALAAVVLRETSSLGLRIHHAERRVLARDIHTVDTPFGPVRVKVSASGAAPEYEDCRRAALEHGAPLRDVLSEATYAWLKNSR